MCAPHLVSLSLLSRVKLVILEDVLPKVNLIIEWLSSAT